MKKRLLAAAIACFSAPAFAADMGMVMNKEDIRWMDTQPPLPKGAKTAVLQGDPSKPGAFTVRMMAPANYKVPAHWHSKDESLTVLSGTLYFGQGDKMKAAGAHAIKPGGFHHVPAKTRHYIFTKAPVVLQVTGEGPFDMNYVEGPGVQH
jgi:mannose-6-phosphate isomerase-like protein (cupin superfamily)